MNTRKKYIHYWMNLSVFISQIAYWFKSTIVVQAETLEFAIGADGLLKITGSSNKNSVSAWQEFFTIYRSLVTLLAAMAAITMVLLFIVGFIQLGASAGNPNARSEAIKGIIYTGIATALLGSVSLFTFLSYSAFSSPNKANESKYENKVIREKSDTNIREVNGVIVYEKLSSSA